MLRIDGTQIRSLYGGAGKQKSFYCRVCRFEIDKPERSSEMLDHVSDDLVVFTIYGLIY